MTMSPPFPMTLGRLVAYPAALGYRPPTGQRSPQIRRQRRSWDYETACAVWWALPWILFCGLALCVPVFSLMPGGRQNQWSCRFSVAFGVTHGVGQDDSATAPRMGSVSSKGSAIARHRDLRQLTSVALRVPVGVPTTVAVGAGCSGMVRSA